MLKDIKKIKKNFKKNKRQGMSYYSKEKLDEKLIEEIKLFFVDPKTMEKFKFKDDPEPGKIPRSIYKVQIQGEEYFLKKFTYKKWRNSFLLNIGLKFDKSMRYAKHSEYLNKNGVKNVNPYAIFTYSKNLFNYETILVTKNYCANNDGMTFREFMKSNTSDFKKNQIGVKLVRDFFKMLQNNFYYHDSHFENFLVLDEKIYYLDLESAKFSKKRNQKNQKISILNFKNHITKEFKMGVLNEENLENIEDYFEKRLKEI